MPASGRAGLTLFEDCLTQRQAGSDRKSTRLNSSHDQISYAVFCLKKKKIFVLFRSDPESTRLNSSHHHISYAVSCLKKNLTAYSYESVMDLVISSKGLGPWLCAPV